MNQSMHLPSYFFVNCSKYSASKNRFRTKNKKNTNSNNNNKTSILKNGNSNHNFHHSSQKYSNYDDKISSSYKKQEHYVHQPIHSSYYETKKYSTKENFESKFVPEQDPNKFYAEPFSIKDNHNNFKPLFTFEGDHAHSSEKYESPAEIIHYKEETSKKSPIKYYPPSSSSHNLNSYETSYNHIQPKVKEEIVEICTITSMPETVQAYQKYVENYDIYKYEEFSKPIQNEPEKSFTTIKLKDDIKKSVNPNDETVSNIHLKSHQEKKNENLLSSPVSISLHESHYINLPADENNKFVSTEQKNYVTFMPSYLESKNDNKNFSKSIQINDKSNHISEYPKYSFENQTNFEDKNKSNSSNYNALNENYEHSSFLPVSKYEKTPETLVNTYQVDAFLLPTYQHYEKPQNFEDILLSSETVKKNDSLNASSSVKKNKLPNPFLKEKIIEPSDTPRSRCLYMNKGRMTPKNNISTGFLFQTNNSPISKSQESNDFKHNNLIDNEVSLFHKPLPFNSDYIKESELLFYNDTSNSNEKKHSNSQQKTKKTLPPLFSSIKTSPDELTKKSEDPYNNNSFPSNDIKDSFLLKSEVNQKSDEKILEDVLELLKCSNDLVLSQPSTLTVCDVKDIAGVRQAVSIPFREQKILRSHTDSLNNKNWGEFPCAKSISIIGGESQTSIGKNAKTVHTNESHDNSIQKNNNRISFKTAPIEVPQELSMENLPSIYTQTEGAHENDHEINRKKSKSMEVSATKMPDSLDITPSYIDISSEKLDKVQCEIGSQSEIQEIVENPQILSLDEEILKIVKFEEKTPEVLKKNVSRYSFPNLKNSKNQSLAIEVEKINEDFPETKPKSKSEFVKLVRKSYDSNIDSNSGDSKSKQLISSLDSRNSKLQSIEEGKIIMFEEASVHSNFSFQHDTISEIEEENYERNKEPKRKKKNYFKKLKLNNKKNKEFEMRNEKNEEKEENNKKKGTYFNKLKRLKILKNKSKNNNDKNEKDIEEAESQGQTQLSERWSNFNSFKPKKKKAYFTSLRQKQKKSKIENIFDESEKDKELSTNEQKKPKANYFKKKKLQQKKLKEDSKNEQSEKNIMEIGKNHEKWDKFTPSSQRKNKSFAVLQKPIKTRTKVSISIRKNSSKSISNNADSPKSKIFSENDFLSQEKEAELQDFYEENLEIIEQNKKEDASPKKDSISYVFDTLNETISQLKETLDKKKKESLAKPDDEILLLMKTTNDNNFDEITLFDQNNNGFDDNNLQIDVISPIKPKLAHLSENNFPEPFEEKKEVVQTLQNKNIENSPEIIQETMNIPTKKNKKYSILFLS